MKIGIVGGGAIGLLFATYLTEKYDITIYTRSEKQAKVLSNKGLTKVKNGTASTTNSVQAMPYSQWSGKDDVTIITVKQYQLEPIVKKMLTMTENYGKSLLFLQNGMGHLQLIEELVGWNVFLGTVEHGALRVNEHTVKHTGNGETKVALYQGDQTHLKNLITHSSSTNFPFVLEDDYESMLIKKLTVNAVINPLTAVLRVRNGELIRNTYYFQALQSLFNELNDALELEDEKSSFQHIVDICKQTADNQSSMLKDVLEGRPTEIDAILGYVRMVAEKKHLKTPLIDMLYFFIKGHECNEGEL